MIEYPEAEFQREAQVAGTGAMTRLFISAGLGSFVTVFAFLYFFEFPCGTIGCLHLLNLGLNATRNGGLFISADPCTVSAPTRWVSTPRRDLPHRT